MLYPLLFKPIFQERIWGGRAMERLFHKELPAQKRIGESWEISDRSEAENEISNGPHSGKTLRWLMQHHQGEVMGIAKPIDGRFPLLVKILDAEEKLSLQVHPPEKAARQLGGDSKTELWYIVEARPKAELYVGLREGLSRKDFERGIADGTVANCFHRIAVHSGDAMFLPSGRVHAIGSGIVIFEIQQNSDTTYRVFDWNRVDASGKPRALHVRESLESINFDDFEPEPIRADNEPGASGIHIQTLVEDPLFSVEVVTTGSVDHIEYSLESCRIVASIKGEVKVEHPTVPVTLVPGMFCLLPASMGEAKLTTQNAAKFLVAQPGSKWF